MSQENDDHIDCDSNPQVIPPATENDLELQEPQDLDRLTSNSRGNPCATAQIGVEEDPLYPTLANLPILPDEEDEDLLEEEEHSSFSQELEETSSSAEEEPETFECSSCAESGLSVPDALGYSHDDCGVHFCKDCMKQILQNSLEGGQFPPRCCTEQITIDGVIELIPGELFERYHERILLSTMRRPVYCCNRNCSRLLGDEHTFRENENKFVECDSCNMSTCIDCREDRARHDVENVCPDSTLNQAADEIQAMDLGVNDSGDREVHRRCACGEINSRAKACIHMTCRMCGREYCDECGGDWPCPLHRINGQVEWDEQENNTEDEEDSQRDDEHPEDEEVRIVHEYRQVIPELDRRRAQYDAEKHQQAEGADTQDNPFLTEEWRYPVTDNVGQPDQEWWAPTACDVRPIDHGIAHPGFRSIVSGDDAGWQSYMERVDENGQGTGVVGCPHDTFENTYPHGGRCQGNCG